MEDRLHPRAQELADAVRAGVQGLQVRSVVLTGEGADNLAYEVNGAPRSVPRNRSDRPGPRRTG